MTYLQQQLHSHHYTMKSFALLAACFVSVEAFSARLYSGASCTGDYYSIGGQYGCRTPAGLPSDFDAQSVMVEGMKDGDSIYVVTDNNPTCDTSRQHTWMMWSNPGANTCHK